VSLDKAGGLFKAVRLSFRPPSVTRCAVAVSHLIHDVLAAPHSKRAGTKKGKTRGSHPSLFHIQAASAAINVPD